MLERGEAFWILKVRLKESEKNGNIRVGAIVGRPQSMCRHREGEFLGHLERGRWSVQGKVRSSTASPSGR